MVYGRWCKNEFEVEYREFESRRLFNFPQHKTTKHKLIEEGGALKPYVVNKSFNMGTTSAHRIDLALKIRSCDGISHMHYLTHLKTEARL